jgi:HEAT repeat protein
LKDTATPIAVRSGILDALRRMGPQRGEKAAKFLSRQLDREPNPGMRVKLIGTLASLAGTDPQALQGLIDATRDKDEKVRAAAALGLGTMMGKDAESKKKADETLVSLIDAGNAPLVRLSAVQALGMRRCADKTVVGLLEGILSEVDTGGLQYAVVEALGLIRTPEAIDALIGALEHTGSGITDRAVAALASAGVWSLRSVCAALENGATDSLRVRAAEVLGRMSDKDVKADAVSALVKALLNKDQHPGVRMAAATGLGRLGGREAERALVEVSQDDKEDEDVRKSAGSALADLLKLKGILPDPPIGLTPTHTTCRRSSGRGPSLAPEASGRPPSGYGAC